YTPAGLSLFWRIIIEGQGVEFLTMFYGSAYEATDSALVNGQQFGYLQGDRGTLVDPIGAPEPSTIALLFVGILCLISNTYVNLHKRKHGEVNYARFLSGKEITVCPSSDLRANSSIALRFSRKYLANSAVAAWLTAAFQSAFAAFMCRELRFSAASSKSCKVLSEQSSSQSIGGISISSTLNFACTLLIHYRTCQDLGVL
ncbi:MAG: PEP-CTERM sorting domain-containing protein, partial [Acidobacteriota bacterium]|nr:PEP-CTERM sorting domain-containing protein [Acidobacteriota bacterium]